MPTLIEEMKPVVLLKYEFEYREKLPSKRFSPEFSDYQDTDAIEKNNDFLVEYSYASAMSLIEILMEEIELVVAEN